LIALPILYWPAPSGLKSSSPPQAHSEQSKQETGAEPRGTESAPIVVKILPAPKTEEERAQEAQERQEKTTTDRWLMIFTGAVAFFTAALVGATGLLYRAGERQLSLNRNFFSRQARAMAESNSVARQAAEAASTNARAAIAAERAYLFIVIDRDSIEMYSGSPKEIPPDVLTDYAKYLSVRFIIKNFGKTPAIVKQISHQIMHYAELPEALEYAPDLDTVIPPLGEGESSDVITAGPHSTITVHDAKFAIMGDSAIWFYGYIIYDDVFGSEIQLRFRWKYCGSGPLRLDYQREFVQANPR
jgi:hypothetical protein